MVLPDGPNQRWSIDFVSDSRVWGRHFRIRCVVDDYTRECLALVADTSLSGVRVARELMRLTGVPGKPHTVVSDNGTEVSAKKRNSRPSIRKRKNLPTFSTPLIWL
jgi:putative transposase